MIGTVNVPGPNPPASASYSLDGGSPTTFTLPNSTDIVYGQTFFKAESLSAGSHDVEITILPGGTSLFIDYFLVDGISEASTTTSALPSGVTTTTSAASTATGSPTAIADSSHKSSPVGAIAGGVAGAVVLILAILYICFCSFPYGAGGGLWRRRRRRNSVADLISDEGVFAQTIFWCNFAHRTRRNCCETARCRARGAVSIRAVPRFTRGAIEDLFRPALDEPKLIVGAELIRGRVSCCADVDAPCVWRAGHGQRASAAAYVCS